jgi:hypothetical protein
MPRSTHRARKPRGEVMPLLSVSIKIESLLREMLTTFPLKGEVTVEEIEHWHRDLQPFSIQAIEWSFDVHRRNGRFFPLYGEILDLCIGWSPPEGTSSCDAACKKRHGSGYHSNDILWLMERYNQVRATLPNRALTDGEVEKLLVELDKKRGSVPAFRREHGRIA